MAVSRFAAPISDEDEAILRSGAVPQKTQSTTDWGIRVWKEWAAERNPQSADGRCPLSSSLLLMSVDDFSYWLAKFVVEVRKKDGTQYPPKSLYALVCCFKHFFEANNRFDVNPLSAHDGRFVAFRQTLDAEMKTLHKKGLGTKTKRAEPITPDEEALLCELTTLDIQGLFPNSSMTNCTFNISVQPPQ